MIALSILVFTTPIIADEIEDSITSWHWSLRILEDSLELDSYEQFKYIRHKINSENFDISKNLFYATDESWLAYFCYKEGDYNHAILLESEALEIRKNALGSNHLDCASSMSDLAFYYSCAGDYDNAIRLECMAMEINKMTGNNYHGYSESLLRIADYYYSLESYTNVIEYANAALEIKKSELGNKHPECAIILGLLATTYYKIGDSAMSLQMGKESLDIYKKAIETDNTFYRYYFKTVMMLIQEYSKLENYKEAIQLGIEGIEICKDVIGIDLDYEDFARLLIHLAICYKNIENNNMALLLVEDYISIVRRNVLYKMLSMTASERDKYWNQFRDYFSSVIPFISVDTGMPEIASMLYDNSALFAKGLLLTTELEITKLLPESSDDETIQLYSDFHKKRQILNEQYAKPVDQRNIDCDSLEKVSTKIEHQLIDRLGEFGEYTRNLNITWRDVQSKLNDTDIAIEFLSYHENDSTTIYIALTLCKSDTTPVLMPLFTETQLFISESFEETHQTSLTDVLVWGPLSSRIEDKSRVFFSPSGILHNIGIEYLPSMKDKECYRLSSTRELVTHRPAASIKSASLFGGIDYDTTYAAVKAFLPKVINDSEYAMNSSENKKRGAFDYRTMRYGVQALPYAHTELKEVSTILTSHGVPCDTLTGLLASEESFKALSGQRKSLLHIATHGFYYDIEEADNMSDHIRMMLIGDERSGSFEDQSLLRCGLCFAGANQILQDSLPPSGQDDGILNALEIAQTDLRDLDLVVLSACQTALGDIDYGEGVFGLQRGFKKAGAQSILMSLWDVDDKVTHIFMTEFYRAWTSGMTKTQALRKAQTIVKEKYPDPHYWAAFILLDALD